MKTLTDILSPQWQVTGPANQTIRDLQLDSRLVQTGDLFAALSGTASDGHQFIDQAIRQGARTILCMHLPPKLDTNVTYLVTQDSTLALAEVARKFFDDPSRKTRLVGVTGTNGKTTIASLLYQAFKSLGFKVGLISTVIYRIGDEVIPSTHTTPDVIILNRLLNHMVEAGCDYVFMEVSSHAVKQGRIAGLTFTGGIFSNLTHDHLDYHGTFADYLACKKAFFDHLPASAFALVNLDDRHGKVMVQNTPAAIYGYGLKSRADFKGKIKSMDLHGLCLEVERIELYSKLVGQYNAYNLLAIYGAGRLLGLAQEDLLPVISTLHPAEGRFDVLYDPSSGRVAVVDYAHTPDALEKVLTAIQAVKPKKSRLICVIGCGGNRDAAKRPKMGYLAAMMADETILTSDNPRFEEPQAIIDAMYAGVPEDKKAQVLTISDRLAAIKTAWKLANRGDVLLIAGKGHEKYQEIKGVKYPFDDKQIINSLITS